MIKRENIERVKTYRERKQKERENRKRERARERAFKYKLLQKTLSKQQPNTVICNLQTAGDNQAHTHAHITHTHSV